MTKQWLAVYSQFENKVNYYSYKKKKSSSHQPCLVIIDEKYCLHLDFRVVSQ